MRDSSRPIGVFDSGVGGLSVLREIAAAVPHESIVYVADQRFAPYGERSRAEVAARAIQITGQLIEAGAKVVTVACNTASAAALHDLRRAYPRTPIVGMEPAVKPAVVRSTTRVIGVLATATTFQGALFSTLVDRHAKGATVLPIVGACLAGLVESGATTGPEAKELLRGYLGPLLDAGMDTLVLGCTHYPFLLEAIRGVVGDRVELVDPSPAVARQVTRVLGAYALEAPLGRGGDVTLATTADPSRFSAQVDALIGLGDGWVARRW
jgi:glutamate racemase